jgi:hypothetical protein
VLPGPLVSAPHRAALLPLTPSRTQSLPTGPVAARPRLSATCASSHPRSAALPCRVTSLPPMPAGRGLMPATELSPAEPGPPSLFPVCPSTWHQTPDPLLFPSPLRAPEHLQKPPTSLPFLSVFLLHPLHAPLPPSSPLSLSMPSPGRLTTSPPEVRATPGIESPPPR